MTESFKNVYKTLQEKEKLHVTSNFSFPHSVFKTLILQTRKNQGLFGKELNWLIIFVYLLSLPVAHLSDASRRRLVVTGDSARIQDETTENSAWFFNVLGV